MIYAEEKNPLVVVKGDRERERERDGETKPKIKHARRTLKGMGGRRQIRTKLGLATVNLAQVATKDVRSP